MTKDMHLEYLVSCPSYTGGDLVLWPPVRGLGEHPVVILYEPEAVHHLTIPANHLLKIQVRIVVHLESSVTVESRKPHPECRPHTCKHRSLH